MKNQTLSLVIVATILGWGISTQAQAEDLVCSGGDEIGPDVTYDNVTVIDDTPGDCLLINVTILGDIEIQDAAGVQIVSTGNAENTQSRVAGSIYAETGSRLLVNFFSVIEGGIDADGAEQVSITGSSVYGNVNIKDNSGNSGCKAFGRIGQQDQSSVLKIVKNKGSVALNECIIYGELKVSRQDPQLSGDEEIGTSIRQSEISGPLRIRKNFGGTVVVGDTEIDGDFGNYIGDNLKVRLNENTDVVIGGNVIAGNLNCEDNPGSSISDPDPMGSNDVQGNAKNDCEVGFDSTP